MLDLGLISQLSVNLLFSHLIFFRYMVWADYDYAQRKIMRADLTGENQIVLVNSYSLFGLPLHVVIDHSTSRVYWTDIHYAFAYIVSVKLNGRNFAYEKFLSIRYFPYDLTIFQNNLYWADVNLNGIAWFPFKDSSVKRVQTVDDLSPHSVVGVVVSDLTRQPLGMLKSVFRGMQNP